MTKAKAYCPETRAYGGMGWGCQRPLNHRGKCRVTIKLLGRNGGEVLIRWVRRTQGEKA